LFNGAFNSFKWRENIVWLVKWKPQKYAKMVDTQAVIWRPELSNMQLFSRSSPRVYVVIIQRTN